MHQAGDLAAAFRFDGHNVAPAAHRHDRILQVFLVRSRADHFIELFAHAGGRRTDAAADGGKLRRSVVGYLFLRNHDRVDLFFEILVGDDGFKPPIERRFHALALAAPVRNRAHGAQYSRDPQEIHQVQHAACLRAAQGIRDIFQPAEGRRTEFRH